MADQPRSAPPASQDPEAPAVRTSATLTQTTSYSGPLPPAAELQAYDDAVPGAAERIIRMAESYALSRELNVVYFTRKRDAHPERDRLLRQFAKASVAPT